MKRTLKIIIFGVLVSLFPFAINRIMIAASKIVWYLPDSVHNIMSVFNIIDILTLIVIEGFCLSLYFRKLERGFLSQGVLLGCSWFTISLIVDFPLCKFYKLPISYMIASAIPAIIIPVCSITVGYIAQTIVTRNKK